MTFYLGAILALCCNALYLPFLPQVTEVDVPLSDTVKLVLVIRLASFRHSDLSHSFWIRENVTTTIF